MKERFFNHLTRDQLQEVAFFGALCLFFSVIEYLVPKPVPFFRLGLANLPILLVLSVFLPKQIALLALLKVLGQALVNGTLASYIVLFSASGTIVSVALMFLLHRFARKHISLLGIGIAGSLASNLVQVQLSLWFIFGQQAWIIVPVFLGLGLVSGFAVGMAAHLFSRHSLWYKDFIDNRGLQYLNITYGEPFVAQSKPAKRSRKSWRLSARWDFFGNNLSALTMFVWGLVLLLAFVLQQNITVRAVQLAVLLLLVLLAGKKIQFGYFLVLALSISFFNLFLPDGKELVVIAGLSITQGALLDGLNKSMAIIGMVFISLGTVRKSLKIPGRIGATIASMFLAYENLMSKRSSIRAKTLLADIDRLLFKHQAIHLASTNQSLDSDRVMLYSPRKQRNLALFLAALLTIVVFGLPLVPFF